MGKVTILEIADKLNLSRNTVAKALHGDKSVKESTRLRVVSAAAEMGYANLCDTVCDNDKSSLQEKEKNRNRSKKIILVKSSDISEFFEKVTIGISKGLSYNGYVMSMFIVTDEKSIENRVLIDFIRNEADGVICLSLFAQEFIEELLKYKKPAVFFDRSGEAETGDFAADKVSVLIPHDNPPVNAPNNKTNECVDIKYIDGEYIGQRMVNLLTERISDPCKPFETLIIKINTFLKTLS